ATGSGPCLHAVADFNADGHLDLAVPNYNDGTVSLLRGNGDGTFQPHADFPVMSSPISVVAGDFNRDGRPDLGVRSANVYATVVTQGLGLSGLQNPRPVASSASGLGFWSPER